MSENENPFKILNQDISSTKELSPNDVQGNITERIEEILKSDNIVLFMKGNSEFPQCGFSANTVAILKHIGKSFTTFDILQDMDIRQGLKEYSNWPTFPQLYIKGKLVGGNDIITEMFESGDLQEVLKEV
ncbi:MAG: monothiol glutaredoxin, Grx4 family [Halobacteriovoraceae bacterium]|nr:monothiol glutaredoxin, Grx4 family [Halobacteriovoraceae bacterium]|tara:strand:+ start:6811 stop:7200 length:390 start_codon:yes stop_codon:yes gene_type:complete